MRALHMIHSIDQLHDLPDDVAKRTKEYGWVVVNASFGMEDLSRIRSRFPDALLLASVNAHSIRASGGGDAGRELRSMMAREMDRCDGWDPVATRTGNVPTYLVQQTTAAAMTYSSWMAGVVIEAAGHLDGIYVDELFGTLPRWLVATVSEQKDGSDVPGAGMAVVSALWPSYRDALVRLLRLALGPTATVLANVGQWIPPGDLESAVTRCTVESQHYPGVTLLAALQRFTERGWPPPIVWNSPWDTLPELLVPGDYLGHDEG